MDCAPLALDVALTLMLPFIVLAVALVVALRGLSPDRAGHRVVGVAVLLGAMWYYMTWRVSQTLPTELLSPAGVWQLAFFMSELLSTIYLSWAAIVVTRSGDRTMEADAAERALRSRASVPSVDVFIPTVAEGREVLEATLRAAAQIDWPRLEIFVLDDDRGPKTPTATRASGPSWLGWRQPEVAVIPAARAHVWLPALCEAYGAHYLRRSNSAGFKAGNLNHGLANSSGDVVLVLDSDFLACPNILWRTVGLLRDDVALVQTPQHYYSTDPLQHNLGGDHAFTEEQRFFFDVVLPARDAWGAAVCVGTSFVVRRDVLGPRGFETDCLSEDVYGGYALVSRGYTIRYLNEVLSHGAAADTVPEYVRQRMRWCQGIMQSIWLPFGPVRAPGLTWLQRAFYLDMPAYWVAEYGFLAFLMLAPLVHLFLGIPAFDLPPDGGLPHIGPRVVASSAVGYWLSRGKVMPIVGELRKLVGLHFVLGAMASLLVNPSGGAFKPTLKAQPRQRFALNWKVTSPFLVHGCMIAIGVFWNVGTSTGPLSARGADPLHMIWAFVALILDVLGALASIDWPKDTLNRNFAQPLEGSLLRTIAACARGPSLFTPSNKQRRPLSGP